MTVFKGSQDSNRLTVDFGHDGGLKKANLSEPTSPLIFIVGKQRTSCLSSCVIHNQLCCQTVSLPSAAPALTSAFSNAVSSSRCTPAAQSLSSSGHLLFSGKRPVVNTSVRHFTQSSCAPALLCAANSCLASTSRTCLLCTSHSCIGSLVFTPQLRTTWKFCFNPILTAESCHLVVASGVITEISRSHVSVSFSKCLHLPWSNSSSEADDLFQEVWRINKDEAMTTFSIMRFNLVQLFLPTERSSCLRKMIVDLQDTLILQAPRFDSGCILSQDPAISYIWSEKSLNDDQRRAILKILAAKDYALILGMPGTGKTSTMVHAVKALLIRV
ncbi:DNA replication ATP-dependent helicase/nuclease DNA2-like [Carica papaya]|uniref:DNA replication ATP-dependent helicase/nuclease DNA2-like n=1 Tax=Carica papaya TaxID=3649 RepID=UPI000B8CB9C3|nr:DNA replication ATP-dependent helicase/nuclease DNA2-like [Carica papaya]